MRELLDLAFAVMEHLFLQPVEDVQVVSFPLLEHCVTLVLDCIVEAAASDCGRQVVLGHQGSGVDHLVYLLLHK